MAIFQAYLIWTLPGISFGSRYKCEHHVSFPPFSVNLFELRQEAMLHPGPATWKSILSSPGSEHGGEGDKADAQEFTSRCTQVCGEGVSARACAKVCLVSVYPAG